MRAHSIGVSVSDTKPETRIATEIVAANSRNTRPDDAAHEEDGDEHGHERQRDRDDGEADLARALERGLERLHPVLDVPDDVLQHHDGVVDDEAHGQASARAARCCRSNSRSTYIAAKVPMSETGRASVGIKVAVSDFRNRKMTSTTRRDRQHQRELDVVHGLADRDRPVVQHVEADGGGKLLAIAGNLLADAVDDLDGVGVGLAEHRDDQRALAVVPACRSRRSRRNP